MREYTAKEEGYVFMYVSNESPTLVDVYFDDVVMTHTKSNIIQYNEYYPFGLQTANSWTRDNSTNNFLYNAGSELNKTTSNYEMFFRDYDPALGRMNQTDPMASKYSSLTPYNYAFNDPVTYNDPMGDDSSDRDYSRFLYFDAPQQHHDASAGMYGSFTRYGPGNSILMAQLNQMWADAKAVTPDNIANYAARYGQTFGGGLEGLQAALSTLMPNQIRNPWAGRETASGGHAGAWQPYSSTIRKLVEERGYKLRTRYKQQKQQTGGRPDLGLIGNAIRDRAGSDFSKDMFENYWLGRGDLILSQDRFLDIWSAAEDLDSKGMRRKGTEYTLPNGEKVYAKQISFYKSEVYKNAFGTATLIFDTNDLVVGFYDYYNFNSRTSRSWDAELKTRSVREASRFSNATPFRIGYGVVPREIFTSRD